jgi:hypothetical protein
MDIEVLNDLYSRARNLGYSKSRESFRVLVSEDADVFNDNYEYIKSQGYTKGQDSFRELLGIDVKKKDISKPVGDGKVITDSTTEQVQAQDILSALQPGKPEDTPIPLRPEEEVVVEEPETQLREFDPKTFIAPKEPLIQDAYPGLSESEFEFKEKVSKKYEERIKKADELGLISYDKATELEETFPNIYKDIFEDVQSDKKFISNYEKLPEDVKKIIEPALIKENEELVGLDYGLIPKEDIKKIISSYEDEKFYENTFNNSVEALAAKLSNKQKIDFDLKKRQGYFLLEDLKNTQQAIDDLSKKTIKGVGPLEEGYDIKDPLMQKESELLKESYNETVKELNKIKENLNEESILINSLDLISENTKLSGPITTASKALNTAIAYLASSPFNLFSESEIVGFGDHLAVYNWKQENPFVAPEGVEKGSPEYNKAFTEYNLRALREAPNKPSEEVMKTAVDIAETIRDFLPQDYRDSNFAFAGEAFGQLGFQIASARFGGRVIPLGGAVASLEAGRSMSKMEMYEDAINSGVNHYDAMVLANQYANISAPLEMLPIASNIGKGISKAGLKTARKKIIDEILEKGAKNFTKEVASKEATIALKPLFKRAGVEFIEEGGQEGLQYNIGLGLAKLYNENKQDWQEEFIKEDFGSDEYWKNLGLNIILGGLAGGLIGTATSIIDGDVIVGSNYNALEEMFLDSKQMSKINDQLTAYKRLGIIKNDEDLEIAKEQVGIVQSAISEVSNATKTRPEEIGAAQKRRLFELTAERLSIQKEIEGVNTPSLVADRKQRIEELDQEISDVITGKITTEEILDRDKVKTEVTEEELVDDFVVSEEEYKNFVDNGEVTEETINKIADIVQQGKKISDKKTLAIYNDKVSEINKILSGRQDSKIAKENKRVDEIFAEEDFDVSEKLSDNLARNKSPEFQIGEKENKIINLATKAAKAIQRVAPNVRVVLHDTTEEYNEFGTKGTKGVYNPQTKIIHIDLSEATNTTVAHETFHSILFNTIGTEKDIEAATNDMYESVKRALATSPIMKRKIRKFSEKYGDDLKSEEALSELFGMLSTDYKQLSAPVKVKIKQFINKVATKFGLGDIIQLSEQDLSDLETIDLLNTMSARVKEGKTILKKEAKPLTDKKVKDKKPDTSNENPAIREQKGLINITEKDVIKFKKADITEKRTIQAINQIGLSQVKFKREEILKKISEEFEKLMKNSDDYLISVDGPAITASIQNEIDNAAEQGYSLEYLENLTGALEEGSPERKRYFDTFVNTQRSSIEQWKNYLSESDYDPAFKYLILDAVLTNNYDYKLNKYQKRTKSTIRGFTPFDAGSLAEVYASDSKELLKDYVVSQVNNAKNIAEKQLMVTTNEGKWLKFEGGPNANNIAASANALSQLVQDTYWCTKTNAKSQLEGGDFYVYVTDDAGGNPIPRIAVRMEGDRVGEVRGNASAAQDLEADMLPVAEKFLVDNIPNDSGKRWLESINYNKKVKNFTEKINKQKMKIDFVYEYGEILAEEKKFRVDYDENGLVSLMKQDFDDVLKKSDLYKNKKVVRDEADMNENTEIFLGDFLGTVEIPNSLKQIIGNFRQKKSYVAGVGAMTGVISLKNITTITGDIGSNNIEDLGKLETVGGELFLQFSQVTSLGNLKTVGGNVKLQSSQVKDLGKLERVGRDLDLRGSQVTDLGKIKTIGRNFNLKSLSSVTSLGNLETVGGDLDLEFSQVKDLGNLKSVGRSVYLNESQVTDLGNLETVGNSISLGLQAASLGNLKSVGGSVYLRASQVASLGNLETVGGDIDLEGSQVKDLGKLKSVGGELDLRGSQVTDLGKLKTVGGNVNLQGSQVKSLGDLKSVGGEFNLRASQVASLGNLETVGGDLDLRDSQVKSLGKLETVGGDLDLQDSQVTDLGELKSVGLELDLQYTQVKSLGKLKSVGTLYLGESQITSLGKLEFVGGTLDLRDSKVTDLGNLQTVGGNLDLRDSQVTSLGDLKSVGAYIKLQDSQVTSLDKLENVGGDILGDDELAKQFEDSQKKPAIREQKADVSKIKEARSKLSKAKKNLKRKLGAAVDAGPLLNRLLAVNPTIVPESVYDKYLEILDMLSENAEELKLDKAQEVSTKTEEILNKIEDESAKEPEKEKGKKKEYKREKNRFIKDIKKAASVRNPKFALNEESVFAKYLKKLAKSKAVEELSINELKTLSRVLDNINNGWLSHTAWRYATKLQGITNSNVATDAIAKAKLGFVTNAYNNFKRFITFTQKGTVQKALESIPKYYIDQALSVGQSTDIFDSVLRGIAEAEQIYNFDLRAINKRITAVENAVLKSLKYDGNKAIESSVKSCH